MKLSSALIFLMVSSATMAAYRDCPHIDDFMTSNRDLFEPTYSFERLVAKDDPKLGMSKEKMDYFLGGGAFGSVFKIAFKNPTHRSRIAMKTVKFDAKDAKLIKLLDIEMSHLSNFHQKQKLYFMKYFGCAKYTNEDSNAFLFIERLQESLKHVIRNDKNDNISFYNKLEMLLMVTRALRYMESWNLVHLDIKPDNIMISHVGNQMIIKVIDYGFVLGHKVWAQRGSTYYQDPMMTMSLYQTSARSDIYSLVLTLEDVLTNFDTHRKYNEVCGKVNPKINECRTWRIELIGKKLNNTENNTNAATNQTTWDMITVYQMIYDVVSRPAAHNISLTNIHNTLEAIIRRNNPASLYLSENVSALEELVIESERADLVFATSPKIEPARLLQKTVSMAQLGASTNLLPITILDKVTIVNKKPAGELHPQALKEIEDYTKKLTENAATQPRVNDVPARAASVYTRLADLNNKYGHQTHRSSTVGNLKDVVTPLRLSSKTHRSTKTKVPAVTKAQPAAEQKIHQEIIQEAPHENSEVVKPGRRTFIDNKNEKKAAVPEFANMKELNNYYKELNQKHHSDHIKLNKIKTEETEARKKQKQKVVGLLQRVIGEKNKKRIVTVENKKQQALVTKVRAHEDRLVV